MSKEIVRGYSVVMHMIPIQCNCGRAYWYYLLRDINDEGERCEVVLNKKEEFVRRFVNDGSFYCRCNQLLHVDSILSDDFTPEYADYRSPLMEGIEC